MARARRKTDDKEREVQLTVAAALQSAADYIDEEIGPDRIQNGQYYRGEPFGNEEEGRSQVVSQDVRDTVQAIMPSLMRVFFGAERVVEFEPERPDDVAMAEQATDYVNYIVTRDNPGFHTLHAAFKDALVNRTGIIKYWWDESEEVTEETYEGLDDDTLAMLLDDDELELVADESVDDEVGREMQLAQLQEAHAQVAQQAQQVQQQAALAEQQGMPPPQAPEPPQLPDPEELPVPQLHNVTVKRRHTRGRVRIMAVPPEEFLIGRSDRSIDSAGVVAHRAEKTVSELVAMGFSEDELAEYGDSTDMDANSERLAREPYAQRFGTEPSETGATRKILYTEAWVRLDMDDDGINELRKVSCLGGDWTVVRNEPANEAPFADLCPDPEPHRFVGMCPADVVKDIQRIKSNIKRNMLDSLAQSIHPRMAVVEGQVNMDDVLNNETGNVIRERQPGMARPLTQPFVGKEAFPLLEYMDNVKEKRTGITDATMGLDADALQSTTKMAAQATVHAAQQQIELITRIFAETGMKRLYKGVLGLVVRHQDKPRTVRLRDEWVQMDPRSWHTGMDVVVNTALGTGTPDEKMAMLGLVSEKQEQILQTLGPNNPLVTLGQYSHTLTKMVELAGFRDAGQFVSQLPADFQPPEPEPQPSPEQMLAEVQREEIRANIEKKAAELELEREQAAEKARMDREEMLRRDDRERDRQEADVLLRAADIQGKHGMGVDVERILDLMRRNRGPEQRGQYQ